MDPAAGGERTVGIDTTRGKDGFTLDGRDAWQQLVVTGQAGGAERDLTRTVAYETVPAGIVRVDAGSDEIRERRGAKFK